MAAGRRYPDCCQRCIDGGGGLIVFPKLASAASRRSHSLDTGAVRAAACQRDSKVRLVCASRRSVAERVDATAGAALSGFGKLRPEQASTHREEAGTG